MQILVQESKFTDFLESFDLQEDFRAIIEQGLNSNKIDEETARKLIEKFQKENTTGSGEPTATPKAFKKKKEPLTRNIYENLEKSIDNMISELNYKDFKNSTQKGRVNSSIKEINQKLRAIESILKHTVRLKEEAGLNGEYLSTEARVKVAKIKERLANIIRNLGKLQ